MPRPTDPLKIENERKYLKSPTFQQVDEFVKELGVTYASFERYFGIAEGTIRKMKDPRPLPARHWHIIYEKIVPTYGIGFNNPEYDPKIYKKKTRKKKKIKKHVSQTLLNRLSEF